MKSINISIAVDSIAALSDQSLEGNLIMMDDGDNHSQGQGTAHLITHCRACERIKWEAYPVDLQTPVTIKNISFHGSGAPLQQVPTTLDPNHLVWSGVVSPLMRLNTRIWCRIVLQIGRGIDSILQYHTSSIVRIS